MKRSIVVSVSVLLAFVAGAGAIAETPGQGAAGASTDVLDRPAMLSPLAAKRLLISIAQADGRLVAVGPRGHIVVSPDGGQTWQQSAVPVSSDLTAVCFPDASHGWAVGHDGVVLATTDGGKTWVKQLDGRSVNDLVLSDMRKKAEADPASTWLQGLLAEAERNKEVGPDKPFLDVWFENERHGFVVGAYNLILETSDGGQAWRSWFDRVPNHRLMNLYAIRPAAGSLFIAGEAGQVFRLDPGATEFEAVPAEYGGSLFTLAGTGDAVIVAGLRGNAFRSANGGRHWEKIDSRLPASIVAAASPAAGEFVLADQGGRLAISRDDGVSFERLQLPKPMPLTDMIEIGDGRFGLTGPFGVAIVAADAAAVDAGTSRGGR